MFHIPLEFLINTKLENKEEPVEMVDGKPKYRKFYPNPELLMYPFKPRTITYEVQDVGQDKNLRLDVTTFFHKKILKWLNTEVSFKKHASKRKFLDSVDGMMHVYTLLRKFVKNSKVNWYDLRDNYALIKQFLANEL
jgi:hypothetical protein